MDWDIYCSHVFSLAIHVIPLELMSSLSSTWEAYHAAQKDLVSSISHRLTSARPIYAVPSHQRQAYSQTVQSTVHELREAQSLLRAASARLQSLELEIFPFLADAESALAPISAVPLEVLRSIILFAVGDPSDTRSVLRVSQVSRAWRNLTLDASELFTHADWNHWHIELIQKWNTRAKHRQLAVTLMPNRFDALFPTAASRPSSPSALRELELEDFRDELFVSLSKCSSLSLTFDCPFNKVLACLGHLAAIIHGCSVLRDLSITSLGFSIIRFKLERPISIERLYLRDIDIIAAPNLQPQHIVYDFAAWSMPLDTLTVLPHLTSLTVFRLMPQRLEGTPDIHLDALKTLEVRPYWNNGARSLPWLLRILKMPNVEHFIMNGVALSASEEKSIWPVVVRTFLQCSKCPSSSAVSYQINIRQMQCLRSVL
ncbi:hypothetical protein DL93DRAFT_1978712 [Clavulina sp. PMI_390]|nr:hypothetical protein DL93DRAFT_1978712 [Clavulina sp. PMI_390]